MKQTITFLMLFISTIIVANPTIYVREGNTFVLHSSTGELKAQDTKTPYTVENKDGSKDTIYVSKNGSAYTNKTSKKSGKNYKKYLGAEVSGEICKLLGLKFKVKTK